MKDSTFTVHQYNVALPTVATPFEIVFLGDVHLDSSKCAKSEFKQDVKELKRRKNVHVLLMGDENDAASFKERRILADSGLHDTTLQTFDKDAYNRAKEFIEIVRGLNVVGLLSGNHNWQFRTDDEHGRWAAGESTTDVIARELGTRNLGWLTYIRVQVHCVSANKFISFDIAACHGKGGGKLLGTSVNQVEELRKIFPEITFAAFGHNHQRHAFPTPTLTVRPVSGKGLCVKEHEQWLIRSGSYLKAYEPGKEDYVVKALLRPASLGYVSMHGKISRTKSEGSDVMNLRFKSEV